MKGSNWFLHLTWLDEDGRGEHLLCGADAIGTVPPSGSFSGKHLEIAWCRSFFFNDVWVDFLRQTFYQITKKKQNCSGKRKFLTWDWPFKPIILVLGLSVSFPRSRGLLIRRFVSVSTTEMSFYSVNKSCRLPVEKLLAHQPGSAKRLIRGGPDWISRRPREKGSPEPPGDMHGIRELISILPARVALSLLGLRGLGGVGGRGETLRSFPEVSVLSVATPQRFLTGGSQSR